MTTDPRERLIAAMSTSVRERGYADTTVADVVRIARTSRRTFYEQFEDRAACFLALFDATNDRVIAAIADSVDPTAGLELQVDQALGTYLDAVATDPELYRAFVREVPALGDRGAARQLAVIERFADQLVELVEQGRREQPALPAALTADTAIMIVGGVRELMVIAAQQGRDVRELRPGIAAVVSAIVAGAVVAA